ncbi:MAG: alpha/beta hydrolase [Lachnospiraceae bacterium]|nr:alpha/beta hydrolase [Lachnospiraceae bacterium]
MTAEELKKHRTLAEWAGRLAAPKGDLAINKFRVGKIRCEEVIPDFAHNPNYAILYAHGGGYVSGGLDYARILAGKMAIATGFSAYSFAYRLAPEHPYPAALDDGMAVWEYLVENKYEADHIILAGDSAGGNLALCMVQKLISENKPHPKELLLFSPWTDMSGTASSYETNKKLDPILTGEYVMNASKAYIGDEDPYEPRFSPLFGDFTGFPPIYIMAGRNGILLDDSIRLKEKAEQAGIKVWLDIEEKGWHVYQQMPIPIAKNAMKRLSEHISNEIYVSNQKIESLKSDQLK